jgi:hypothetical protein
MTAARVEACASEVAGLAEDALGRGGFDEESSAQLMAAVVERVQAAIGALRPVDEPAPACTRGCAACCTVNVGTIGLEGAAAAAFMRRWLAPEEAARRAAALLRFHEAVRWQDDAERIRAGRRCPLLDEDGACTIHPARPLACRALTSLDADDCRRALEEREDDDGPGLVRLNLLQKALHDAALDALTGVLERRGLDARRRDVSGIAGSFLAEPGLAAAFAAGARVPIE